jgi:hypothetical protein
MAAKRAKARGSAEKEASWRKVIAEWRSSGQTLKQFAAEKGVKYWTARWWGTQLKKRDAERAQRPMVPDGPQRTGEAPDPAFVPVRIVRSKQRELARRDRPGHERVSLLGGATSQEVESTVLRAGTFEILPFGPVRIRVPPDFDPRALRALLDVLEAPC